MKLISLNIEGNKHFDLVKPFLTKEDADIVCLLEAPESIQDWLSETGYQSTFAPMCIKENNGETNTEGIIFASKTPHQFEIIPYYTPGEDVLLYEKNNKRATIRHLVIFANIGELNIALTHFTWNPNGETADEYQTMDMNNMLAALTDKPPHILCGDLNIPRHHNKLYETLLEKYQDNVPIEYKSSLDRNLHRVGNDPDLQKLFNDFMVDYVFTQEPIKVSDTRLVFGVSDHAAVVTNI